MYKTIAIVMSVIVLAGCSSKEHDAMLGSFEQRMQQSQMLQQSEKLLIKDANETLLAITATYLNGKMSLEDNTTNEQFIVGLYSVTGDEIAPSDINLTLDGQEPLASNKLEEGDSMLSGIPAANQWFVYYRLEFAHTEKKKKIPLQITYPDPQSGEPKNSRLLFSKIAKYL